MTLKEVRKYLADYFPYTKWYLEDAWPKYNDDYILMLERWLNFIKSNKEVILVSEYQNLKQVIYTMFYIGTEENRHKYSNPWEVDEHV